MKKTRIRALSCLFPFLFLVSPAVLYSEAATTTTITNGKYYAIQNVHSGQFLDVRHAEFVSGNNIWQYPCNTTDSQQFLILDPENGITSTAYHQIAPKGNPSLRLDVDNAWDVNGTNIGIFMSNPGYGAQSFEFIPNGDGSFRIKPYMSSTRVFSVANSSTADCANVELRTWNGDNCQRWIFKEIDQYYFKNWRYFFRDDAAASYRKVTTRFSSSHIGIDVPAPAGTPIYSPVNGEVIDRGKNSSMGNYVIVFTYPPDAIGVSLTYRIMHMNSDPLVAKGQYINADTLLGYVGNTGDSYGNHVHIDVNNKGYKNGSEIRGDPSSAVPTESVFPGVRFTHSSGDLYA